MVKVAEQGPLERVGTKDLSTAVWRLTTAIYVAYLTAMLCGFFLVEKVIWVPALGGIAMATIAFEALAAGELFAGSRFVKMHEEPITFTAGILVTLALSAWFSWMGLFPWR